LEHSRQFTQSDERNAKLCTIIQKIAEGIAGFSTDSDVLGDAYEYLIGQFAAGSGKVRNQLGAFGIGKIYGQEKNITTYNLARIYGLAPKSFMSGTY
jgi:type I restriction enzyme M protein